MKQEITQEIQDEIKKLFWIDEGKTMISMGNSRLDFKKDYYFVKFTRMGVRLYWLNGTERVYVVAKVELSDSYKDYALYTESWHYIERLKLKGGKNATN